MVLGLWARGSDVVVDPDRGFVTLGPPGARRMFRLGELARVEVVDGGLLSPGEARFSFQAWLLNLVLKGGERLNLTANSDREGTRGIGERLARSLGVPFSR